MKKHFKNLVFRILVVLVHIRIKRLRPFIIGVTGSVGKTSTKDAIYTILRTRYQILRNEKSYNTEFGLPLAILEQPSGFSSSSQWASTLLKGLKKALFGGRNLQMMVLEMGVDKPGDMDVLLKMIHPQIGLITAIKPVHLAPGQFKDLDDIVHEKSKLLFGLPQKGTAIMNIDDPYLSLLPAQLHCKTMTYGKNELADLRLLKAEQNSSGIEFTVSYGKQLVSSALPLLGLFQIYVVLPALAVALTQGFSLQEACEALQSYQLPPGRMNILQGIHETTLIDSSYNASPETMKEALMVLSTLKSSYPSSRLLAILGSMNELGMNSEKYHRQVGAAVYEHANILVTVGEEARGIAEGAKSSGMPTENILCFQDVHEAIKKIPALMKKGDMILLKGSQNNVRLEKLVEALLKDPSRASNVLVRQDKNW